MNAGGGISLALSLADLRVLLGAVVPRLLPAGAVGAVEVQGAVPAAAQASDPAGALAEAQALIVTLRDVDMRAAAVEASFWTRSLARLVPRLDVPVRIQLHACGPAMVEVRWQIDTAILGRLQWAGAGAWATRRLVQPGGAVSVVGSDRLHLHLDRLRAVEPLIRAGWGVRSVGMVAPGADLVFDLAVLPPNHPAAGAPCLP